MFFNQQSENYKMKNILVVLLISVVSACAAVRAPFQMAVTDLPGNTRPYYVEGEALNLHVYWDATQDTGKPVDCAVSNSFSGEVIWRSILIIPEAKPGQLITTAWNPPFPETGLKPKAGLYLAVCSFNNEEKASISLNVIKLGGADGT
jgi:hypothetical protein